MEADRDARVQETNVDAQVSKMSCVRLGYFKDDFLPCFVRKGSARRAPIINRGYFARAAAIKQLIQKFLSASSSIAQRQILSLGAGFDTTWFHLKVAGQEHVRYIEVDFQTVTKKKAEIITNNAKLSTLLEQKANVSIDEGGITSCEYNLVAADLRDTDSLEAALQRAGLQTEVPTLILAECVLVYMPPESSRRIVSRLGSLFSTAAFVIYEQINPDDPFGQQMLLNLESRGCPLIGIHGTPDLERQKQRFTQHHWQEAWAMDMDTVYAESISPQEKHRIERLEIFDELEEWHLIQEHYCIAVGINDSLAILKGLSLPTYKPAVPHGLARGLPTAD